MTWYYYDNLEMRDHHHHLDNLVWYSYDNLEMRDQIIIISTIW